MTLDLPEKTAIDLFQRLEEQQIRYAVLRNHENFPQFGHDIDLVMHPDDFPRWQQLAVQLAQNQQWQALTYCSHWAQSATPHHCIQVYRFYNQNPLVYLQVDIFQAYLLWALPLMTESALLNSAQKDDRGFWRLDPAVENMFRLLQINNLLKNPNCPEQKIIRYRQRVLDYANAHESVFLAQLQACFRSDGLPLLRALRDESYQAFQKAATTIKFNYLKQELRKRPGLTLSRMMDRALDYFSNFFSNPCGFVVNIYAEPDADWTQLTNLLNRLQQANLLYGWTDRNRNSKSLSWPERGVLERGGIVLKTVSQPQAAKFILSAQPNELALETSLITLLIDRHETLCTSCTSSVQNQEVFS